MTPIFIIVLCLICAAFVLLPLRSRATSVIEYSNRSADKDLKEKQARLRRQLSDLNFDRSMQKVNEDDYESARADLNAQLETIEQNLRLATTSKETVSSADFDLEAEVLIARARRKRVATNDKTWTCECGRAMSDADKFCASCGAARAALSSIVAA